MPIKLQRGGSEWVIVGAGVLSTAKDLDVAAFKAVFLAELHGTTVELDSELPEEVLLDAQQHRAELQALQKRVQRRPRSGTFLRTEAEARSERV